VSAGSFSPPSVRTPRNVGFSGAVEIIGTVKSLYVNNAGSEKEICC